MLLDYLVVRHELREIRGKKLVRGGNNLETTGQVEDQGRAFIVSQLANCQIAISVLGSSELVGTGKVEGISWWWNQVDPGKAQTMMKGVIVDTDDALSSKLYEFKNTRTGLQIEEEQTIYARQCRKRILWHSGLG